MSVSIRSSETQLPFGVVFDERGKATSHRHVRGIGIDVGFLAGVGVEQVFGNCIEEKYEPSFAVFRAGELKIGYGYEVCADSDLDAATRRLYGRLLETCRGLHLYRIWNYVPRINVVTDGLENYQAFCRGRSHAFESIWGPNFQASLPAASAVGCDGDRVSLVFAAGSVRPRYLENPEQIPAYEYPREHGPRSPSFSRASRVKVGPRQYAFISGTAAIKGHSTVAPGTLAEQIACTLDNLKLISQTTELGENLGAGEGWERHFKIYLRRAEDLATVQKQLDRNLLLPTDRVSWLRSDICRAALEIEIEATLVK